MILDIGCGSKKTPGSLGIDIHPYEGVDIVHNLDISPWPIEDNTIDVVMANHIIEHVENISNFMKEVHRVTKPSGKIIIKTPQFTSLDSWADPTHRWHLSTNYAEQFIKGSYLAAQVGEFKILVNKVSFGSFILTWPARLICAVFGRRFWERYFSFIFRARNLHTELEIIKNT